MCLSVIERVEFEYEYEAHAIEEYKRILKFVPKEILVKIF